MRVLLVIFFCIGCAGGVDIAKYCNYDGAFTRGSNDAEFHHPADETFIKYCPADEKNHAQNGYRGGYSTTRESTMGRISP